MIFSRVAVCIAFLPVIMGFAGKTADVIEGGAIVDLLVQMPFVAVMLYVWNSTRKDHKELMSKLIERLEKIEQKID